MKLLTQLRLFAVEREIHKTLSRLAKLLDKRRALAPNSPALERVAFIECLVCQYQVLIGWMKEGFE